MIDKSGQINVTYNKLSTPFTTLEPECNNMLRNIHARIYFMAWLRRVGVYVDYSIIQASSFTIERGLEVPREEERKKDLLHQA